MTTKEIRDKIVEQKTLFATAQRESEKACAKIEDILNSVTEEEIEALTANGFDTSVFDINISQLREKPEYVTECINSLNSFCDRLHSFLEEQLASIE